MSIEGMENEEFLRNKLEKMKAEIKEQIKLQQERIRANEAEINDLQRVNVMLQGRIDAYQAVLYLEESAHSLPRKVTK